MRLCGHIQDPFDGRDYDFLASSLYAAAPLITSADIDLRPFCPPVANQIANNCCAHATSTAAFATASCAWHPIKKPSVAFLYSVARLIGDPPRRPGEPRLTDWGSGLRFMFEGMGRWGLIAEERWQEWFENINTVPPDDCWREGENATIEAYYRIPDGPSASDGVLAALQRGYFPVFAMLVDERWSQIGREVWDEPGGKALGWHAMVVVGYSATLDAFLVMNSWGRDFGFDGGFAWLSRRAMNERTVDKWVIDCLPGAVS